MRVSIVKTLALIVLRLTAGYASGPADEDCREREGVQIRRRSVR